MFYFISYSQPRVIIAFLCQCCVKLTECKFINFATDIKVVSLCFILSTRFIEFNYDLKSNKKSFLIGFEKYDFQKYNNFLDNL